MEPNTTIQNSDTAGLAPGTVIYVGEKNTRNLCIDVLSYDKSSYEYKTNISIVELLSLNATQKFTWISVNGLNHTEAIEKIGKNFKLHPLILEDIANTHQRPKIDEFEDYMYVVLKILSYDDDYNLCFEHVSFVLGKDYIITFSEADNDVFEGVRKRIQSNKGLVRESAPDYLLYLLMDAVVDDYFELIEDLGEQIGTLEESLFVNKQEFDTAQDIHHLKREIIKIRRMVFPVREMVKRIERTDHKLFTDKTQFYLRDLLDHTIQVSENIEIYRETISGLMDMYMSNISNKMNEVMKVLTIIATIFIPLTFIAGVYGMNFENMPGLKSKYAYHTLIGVMVLIFVGLLYFFRRKKWL